MWSLSKHCLNSISNLKYSVVDKKQHEYIWNRRTVLQLLVDTGKLYSVIIHEFEFTMKMLFTCTYLQARGGRGVMGVQTPPPPLFGSVSFFSRLLVREDGNIQRYYYPTPGMKNWHNFLGRKKRCWNPPPPPPPWATFFRAGAASRPASNFKIPHWKNPA